MEALGKEAETVMLRMKEFKAIREQDKSTLRELTRRAGGSTTSSNLTSGTSTTS